MNTGAFERWREQRTRFDLLKDLLQSVEIMQRTFFEERDDLLRSTGCEIPSQSPSKGRVLWNHEGEPIFEFELNGYRMDHAVRLASHLYFANPTPTFEFGNGSTEALAALIRSRTASLDESCPGDRYSSLLLQAIRRRLCSLVILLEATELVAADRRKTKDEAHAIDMHAELTRAASHAVSWLRGLCEKFRSVWGSDIGPLPAEQGDPLQDLEALHVWIDEVLALHPGRDRRPSAEEKAILDGFLERPYEASALSLPTAESASRAGDELVTLAEVAKRLHKPKQGRVTKRVLEGLIRKGGVIPPPCKRGLRGQPNRWKLSVIAPAILSAYGVELREQTK